MDVIDERYRPYHKLYFLLQLVKTINYEHKSNILIVNPIFFQVTLFCVMNKPILKLLLFDYYSPSHFKIF